MGFRSSSLTIKFANLLSSKTIPNLRNPIPPNPNDAKRIFMKLPYVKEMTGQISKEINSFLKKLDFKIQFCLVHETCNLRNLFAYKDRQNDLHRIGVVYKIKCSCNATYIGQTARNLVTRLNNHNPNSSTAQDTDVFRHLKDNPDHKIKFNEPEILAQSDHWRKLLISETLLVLQHNPDLNVEKISTPLYLFNT